MISVDIGAPDPGMAEAFDALVRVAQPNVFMHPAALCAAAETGFAKIHVLRAFEDGALVGFWALRESRVAPFWPPYLSAPPYDYAFVASPVIRADRHDAVAAAFVRAIAADKRLPNVIKLKLLDGDEASRAMMAAVTNQGGQLLQRAEHARPFLGSEADRKRSGSTAKKLRQDWNKLSAQGTADVVNAREADAVRAAFEVFLELEAKSWKGASNTALLSHAGDAAFARRFIANLSARGDASVALLRLDGKVVAAQVLLYALPRAYTWKTAFDAEFAKFSPGALLVDKVTDLVFATGVSEFESCATEDSFMGQLWTGRRTTLDLLADVAPGSATFRLLDLGERLRDFAREKRNGYRAWRVAASKRKNLAATQG